MPDTAGVLAVVFLGGLTLFGFGCFGLGYLIAQRRASRRELKVLIGLLDLSKQHQRDLKLISMTPEFDDPKEAFHWFRRSERLKARVDLLGEMLTVVGPAYGFPPPDIPFTFKEEVRGDEGAGQ